MITHMVGIDQTEESETPNKISRWWAGGILLLYGLPLVTIAILGTFTRFHADDFCLAGQINRQGFWDAMLFWYQNWSGRFASTFFAQLSILGGPYLARIFPGLLIIIWLINLQWLFNQMLAILFKGDELPRPNKDNLSIKITGWLLAASGLFYLLVTIPNLYQSFFWENGWVSYSLPLIWLTFTLSLLLFFDQTGSNKTNRVQVVVICFLALVNGGFSEVYSATQVCLYGFLFFANLFLKDRSERSRMSILFGAAFLGALTGFLLVAAAPGNTNRQLTLNITNHPALPVLILNAMRHAYITGHALVKHNLIQIITALAVSISIGYRTLALPAAPSLKALWRKGWLPVLVLLLPATFGLVTASMAPTEYVMRSYPDARVLIIPQFFITICIIVFGLIAGGLIKTIIPPTRKALPIILMVISLILGAFVTIHHTQDAIRQIPAFEEYSRQWDIRHENLLQARAAGKTEVFAAGLPQYHGLFDLAGEPDNWINACLADYYGFERVFGR